MKKTVKDIKVNGKRVLLRADCNVPIEEGKVTDDTRIRETLPTIEYLREQGARTIICSHLGRPEGKVVEALRLDPVARRLSHHLGTQVRKVDHVVGREATEVVETLEDGDVLLLENTRFHPGETENAEVLARKLASLADVYVNDAFAAAHRAHASTKGVAALLPAVAGLLMTREIQTLDKVLHEPKRPLVTLFGGAKVADKIEVMESFLHTLQADVLLVGGGMANTLLEAKGLDIGDSLWEEDHLQTVQTILDRAGSGLILPVDVTVAERFDEDSESRTVDVDAVPKGWHIMDVGPKTVQLFQDKLRWAKMVVWNGPLGVSEMEPFARGTLAVARTLAETDAQTFVGGGDSAAAIAAAGVSDKITHISTGGGAFLEFLSGKELPGITALADL